MRKINWESLLREVKTKIQKERYTPEALEAEMERLKGDKNLSRMESVFIIFAEQILAGITESDFEENKPITDENWNLELPQSEDSELIERRERINTNENPIAC